MCMGLEWGGSPDVNNIIMQFFIHLYLLSVCTQLILLVLSVLSIFTLESKFYTKGLQLIAKGLQLSFFLFSLSIYNIWIKPLISQYSVST